jgi:hypothetical protein|tara:strand:- start:37 stop:324 length:288 start_codon:yes stop_codon:yes gene_type:complete
MAAPLIGIGAKVVWNGTKWVAKRLAKNAKKNKKQLELDLKPKTTKKKIHKSEDPWSDIGYTNPKVNPRKTKTYGPTKRKYHGKKERNYGNPNKGN